MHPSIKILFDLKSYFESYPIKANVFLHEGGHLLDVGSSLVIRKGEEESTPYGDNRLITEMIINVDIYSGQVTDTNREYQRISELIDQLDTALIDVQPTSVSSLAMGISSSGEQSIETMNKEVEFLKAEISYIFTYKRKITDAEVT